MLFGRMTLRRNAGSNVGKAEREWDAGTRATSAILVIPRLSGRRLSVAFWRNQLTPNTISVTILSLVMSAAYPHAQGIVQGDISSSRFSCS
jgi:hypothetical protein